MTREGWKRRAGVGKTSVLVYADADRGDMLTLRWWSRAKKNYERATLGKTAEYARPGKLTPECEEFAISAAQRKSLELGGVLPSPTPDAAAPHAFTIGETEAAITDKATGKYAHRTQFRDELVRALRFACAVWGADTAWKDIDELKWVALLRKRLEALLGKGAKGVRATEITVSRLVTAVRWLRKKKFIPRDVGDWPNDWKKEIDIHWRGETGSAESQQAHRPRYTLEELQRILAKCDFDPRFWMLTRLAIGLRPGQVARVRRSHLELPPIDWSAEVVRDDKGRDPTDYGAMKVLGAGKKGGVVTDLTRSQRRIIDDAMSGAGHLAAVEQEYQAKTRADYVLFPAGYVVGRVGFVRGKERTLTLGKKINFSKHCSGSWIRANWRRAEERAGVEHLQGRLTYGQRRLTVDIAKLMGLSPSALQDVGGWTNSKMALEVYAEGQNKQGRREARPVRAHILGEDE